MKPTPDEPEETESPPTRAMFETYVDEEARGGPPDVNATVEAATRQDPPETDSILARAASPGSGGNQDQGPDLGLQTDWSNGSNSAQGSAMASRRGIVGKIEAGQTLYSKYLVLRKLGAGAMGDVWLVRHVMLKSQHALKVIVPNFATNAIALMRFQREFEVMATLRHEHAVTIYDACIDADGGYIDMEYVEGQTIHDVLGKARGQAELDPSAPLMPLDWIVRVLYQLCEVLQIAHQKGIVHRDLKPSNMMLLGDRPPGKEYLKVLDFGIAKIRDDPEGVAGREQEEAENKTQGFIGTPSYGSPEQAMGLEVDGRADLYSIGIMLYEFVTGRLPFRGNHWQVMSQNANAPPPSFAEANPRLQEMPELEQAIMRVLAKKPEERPRNARELYEDVRRAVEVILPSGTPGLPQPTWAGSPHGFQPSALMHEPLPSTHEDGFAGEPPTTHADSLLGKSAPSWKSKHVVESPSDIGQSVSLAGVKGPRTPLETFLSPRYLAAFIAAIACAMLIVFLLPMLKGNRADSKGNIPERLFEKKSDPKISKEFEDYWPSTYGRLGDYTQGMPWPEKVVRTDDQAIFRRLGNGIYIPDSFQEAECAGLAADGWPKVITKNDIRFNRIPGGTFRMGAFDNPNAVNRADAPAHSVTLTGYYIQETEVTHGQFDGFRIRADIPAPTEWAETYNNRKANGGTDAASKYPAANISREMAKRFAKEIGGQLPTEAQWEYAARSLGHEWHYVWGNSPPPDRNMARINLTDAGTSMPVGSFERDRTEQGVFDLTGNVQEMCRDAWVPYAKRAAAVVDPCALAVDPIKAEYAIRGAAYSSIPQGLLDDFPRRTSIRRGPRREHRIPPGRRMSRHPESALIVGVSRRPGPSLRPRAGVSFS